VTVQTVSAATAKQWYDAGEARILDVRESFEFNRVHIPGATLLPLRKIASFDPSTITDGQKKQKIVVVCASGQRSAAGCRALAGHKLQLYSLGGGISAWRTAGGDIEGSATAPGTADRSRQLGLGAAALLGFLLGTTVDPGFHLLSGMSGVALVMTALLAA